MSEHSDKVDADSLFAKVEKELIGPGRAYGFVHITYCHVCGNNVERGHMADCAWAQIKALVAQSKEHPLLKREAEGSRSSECADSSFGDGDAKSPIEDVAGDPKDWDRNNAKWREEGIAVSSATPVTSSRVLDGQPSSGMPQGSKPGTNTVASATRRVSVEEQAEEALSLAMSWFGSLQCHVHGEPRERFDGMVQGIRDALAALRSHTPPEERREMPPECCGARHETSITCDDCPDRTPSPQRERT